MFLTSAKDLNLYEHAYTHRQDKINNKVFLNWKNMFYLTK